MSDSDVRYMALARAAKRGLRVLIVDDHPVNRQVLTLMLAQLPALVSCAENGAEAVKAFEGSIFDVILMDLRMPVMDGYEAMRAIRAREARTKANRTAIIVASAHTPPFDRVRAREAGADQHIGKPIEIPVLFDALDAVLAGSA